ncbi:uncharacterized protein VTP21DRAFT_11711 [Calcarisporiella thermophila]|uniref:uncharacterized protein n=1 Tax=Calcarisporiella thermophila TaxID=911321 RepID=UPI00374326D2
MMLILLLIAFSAVAAVPSQFPFTSATHETNVCPFPLPYIPPPSSSLHEPPLQAALHDIKKLILRFESDSSVKSLSVSLVQGQNTLLTYGPENSYYLIGSITKTFVGLLMMLMRDEGKISLEDKLNKYIPSFKIRDPYYGGFALPTLRMLASHAAGLPREHCPEPDCKKYTEEQVLEYLSNSELLRPLYSDTPAYSNLGISLLGHALERVCGNEWGECLKTYVFNRLGMNSTGTLATPDLVDNFAPNPYGDSSKLFNVGYGNPSAFLTDQLGLQPYSIDEWTRAQTILPDGETAFGMTFELLRPSIETGWMVSKSGSVPGYKSIILFHKQLKLGIVVLVGGEKRPILVATEIMEKILPAIRGKFAAYAKTRYVGKYAGATDECTVMKEINICNGTLTVELNKNKNTLRGEVDLNFVYYNITVNNRFQVLLVPDEADVDNKGQVPMVKEFQTI